MDQYDEIISYAMEQGWIEPVFRDDEITMKIIPDDDNPFWQQHLKETADEVEEMVKIGVLEEAGVAENGETVYQLTEYGKKWAK